MQATMQNDSSAAPTQQVQIDLGEVLCSCTSILTAKWRKLYFEGDRLMTVLPQLDGVMELFIMELGRSLQTLSDMPVSAWSRTSGVLKLSHSRGAEGLRREFDLLRAVLEQATEQVQANRAQQRRLLVMLDAAQAQALALMGQRMNSEEFFGATNAVVRFSGLVVEIV
jgi:hypothetical protein